MTDLNQQIRNKINSIQHLCPTRSTTLGTFPTKGGDGGDDCLWLGLLASVGIRSAEQGVIESQSQIIKAGMFYRNPERRLTDNAGYKAFFSRDMAHGVLLYYATASSKAIAYKSKDAWLNWIDNNRACAVKKPKILGGGCLIRGPFRYAPDDRSDITPTMWAVMGRVWKSNGWSKHAQMKLFENADGDVSVIEADSCPLGYQLHLKAVQAYIKLLTGQSREYREKVSAIAYKRVPSNLFYKILSQEKVTDQDKEEFLKMCPNASSFVPSDNWIWEKDVIDPSKSCGWDFIFLGNLILRMSP